MFAPSEKAVTDVRNWLIESGIADNRIVHSDNKGWLAFDATAGEMEILLNAEYYNFEHSSADRAAVACDE
jgi:tripeptidyl-peptidase-1